MLDRMFAKLFPAPSRRTPRGLGRLAALLSIAAAAVSTLATVFMLATGAPAAEMTAESLLKSSAVGTGQHIQDVTDAIAKFKAGDPDGALKALQAAKRHMPKMSPPEVLMAQMYLSQAPISPLQLRAARLQLEKAVQTYPQDPEAFLFFGDLAAVEMRVAEAELLYAKALALVNAYKDNPKRKTYLEARAHAGSASVDEARERWKPAEDNLRAWLATEDDNGVAHMRLGRALFQLEKYQDAFKEFKAAKDREPKLASAELSMASLYAQSARAKEAAKKPKEAEKLAVEADKYIKMALDKDAKDFATQLTVAQLRLAANNLPEAQKHAELAVKMDPENVDARIVRAMIARYQGELKTAAENLEKAIRLSPSNPTVINQLALVLIEDKNESARKRALEYAEMNARTNQNNFEAAATLGWVSYRLGKTAQADAAFQLVSSSGNMTAEIAYFIAFILNDRRNFEDAAKLLAVALEMKQPFAYREEARKLFNDVRTRHGSDAANPNPPKKPAIPVNKTDPKKGKSTEKEGADDKGRTPEKGGETEKSDAAGKPGADSSKAKEPAKAKAGDKDKEKGGAK